MILPLLELGFGNYVFPSKIIALLSPNSKPTQNIIKMAKNKGLIIDAKRGRKLRSVVLLNTGEVLLSAKDVQTVKNNYLKEIDLINKNSSDKIEPFLDLGFYNYILPYNITSFLNPNSNPVEALVKDAKKSGMCIDVRRGRKAKSVIKLDNGYIILSFLSVDTIKKRYQDNITRYYLKDNKNE